VAATALPSSALAAKQNSRSGAFSIVFLPGFW
jgi:hypothetical protein